MTIETKFNIGDTVYYGDESSYDKGRVDDINIHFYLDKYYVKYKIDKDYFTSFTGRRDDIRFQEFGEHSIYSSPYELIEKQITWNEKKIDEINNAIEGLKVQLEKLTK